MAISDYKKVTDRDTYKAWSLKEKFRNIPNRINLIALDIKPKTKIDNKTFPAIYQVGYVIGTKANTNQIKFSRLQTMNFSTKTKAMNFIKSLSNRK